MSAPQKPPEPSIGLNIPIAQIKQLANMYMQWKWIAPIVGVKIPTELDQILTHVAKGGEATPEEIAKLQETMQGLGSGAPQPNVGEPVLTRHIARSAWDMHYNEGLSFREIADILTKDGYPCSHATVCRYIEEVDNEMRFSRIARLVKIGKIAGIVAFFVAWTWIVHVFL